MTPLPVLNQHRHCATLPIFCIVIPQEIYLCKPCHSTKNINRNNTNHEMIKHKQEKQNLAEETYRGETNSYQQETQV
jgi:hypothetical protein